MTREEAKRRVECCRDFLAANYSDMGEPNFTALNMAIEALSEPTKTDTKRGAIDKGKVLDILIKHDNEIRSDTFDEMWKEIDTLPFTMPTRPKAKWIKVGEHLYECSCCGYNYRNYDGQVMKFCMNCGSIMEGGE